MLLNLIQSRSKIISIHLLQARNTVGHGKDRKYPFSGEFACPDSRGYVSLED